VHLPTHPTNVIALKGALYHRIFFLFIICCQTFNTPTYITLFRPTVVFYGTNSTLQNTPHIQLEYVEYFIEFCQSHRTLLWVLFLFDGWFMHFSHPSPTYKTLKVLYLIINTIFEHVVQSLSIRCQLYGVHPWIHTKYIQLDIMCGSNSMQSR
jgi:hypothetical protein